MYTPFIGMVGYVRDSMGNAHLVSIVSIDMRYTECLYVTGATFTGSVSLERFQPLDVQPPMARA